ncbi:hypothetical protein PHMEG_00034672 [Phytophthora megakarya]|uniref:RxLR effector protein n=1 Tax=Phytophthora megakarya TaxID=4795 RepID=A0A225UQU9_9STRA|nr:hypothetical protein PHMEG_00034672 [Phytophthora megakarya]
MVLVALLVCVVAATTSNEKENRIGDIGADGIVFTSTPNAGNNGGKVTVTTYNNNGFWQRIKRWWKKLISREERLDYADAKSAGLVGNDRLSTANTGAGGIASRVGTGGTVAIDDNDNGGGTMTVTVYNNNGLFERVKRWWNRIIARLTGGTPQRLRQRV